MRMPGFVTEGALPSARATATVGQRGSALLSGVVPQQGCSTAKWNECLGKAASCIPMCASGNIIGCILCFMRDAPDCLPCILNRS